MNYRIAVRFKFREVTCFVRRSDKILILFGRLRAVGVRVSLYLASPNQDFPEDDVLCITETAFAI